MARSKRSCSVACSGRAIQIPAFLVAAITLLSVGCADNSASKKLEETVSETPEKSFPLVVDRLTLQAETLGGDPAGGGMVQLNLVEAPKGTVFLAVAFSTNCLPQGASPSLLTPDGAAQELKQFSNMDGDCAKLPARYHATFNVPVKVKSFVLQIGDQRASIDVSGIKKPTPVNKR